MILWPCSVSSRAMRAIFRVADSSSFITLSDSTPVLTIAIVVAVFVRGAKLRFNAVCKCLLPPRLEKTGDFWVILESRSGDGRVSIDSVRISVLGKAYINVPNTFSPNGDGINEVWKVVMSGLELDSYEVVVVDRGGKEVFYSTDPLEVWTGSTRNGEYISSPSLFIYLVKLKAKGSTELKTYRGHITMVR